MKFDLYQLGPREFENLVQSITVAELGPRVSVFGAGPDGGREATFDGVTVSPKGGAVWDGYGILQVKQKATPASPAEEANWLISEIRKEFNEWHTSKKRKPKPKYVIFASNVKLSAVPNTGGFDRVQEVMKEECRRLHIEEYMIWHSENLDRFLEIHDGIRRSYAAWILPGDVLASIHEGQEGRREQVVTSIKRFLSREILRERFANLDQAGSADDRTIPLADVFVDLPISVADDFQSDDEAKCLETLISICDTNHRPDEKQNEAPIHQANRFVLVGGPGQGKSTVSQLLCQLYRALLIKDTQLYSRNAEIRTAVNRITALADRESLSPKARRWPLKIPLTSLADGIAKGHFSSILEYAAYRVSAVSAINVTSSELKNWLADFPWLLILDGLDEVPGSSNRDEVLNCVNDFLLDADEVNADLVVVATTRPQGYAEEFSPMHYRHYSLMPLDSENALTYGHKLAQARYGSAADDKVDRLMDRLRQAVAEDSTAHLMTTPLQVTIMAVLLDRMGKAPKDRFTLFADYYRVIYERELEKEGPASNLLRDRRADINSIHADIGLLLQTKSERSGDTASRLTLEELNMIIADRLKGEGFKGDSLNSLTAAISRAATDRLVFLVPSRRDEVSFEIRSLQEFWAAHAIMNCFEAEIPKRLRAMSVSAHWRNVLLFALGNIFENRKPLRDVVVTLVTELNAASDHYGHLQRRVLTGSRLAVEILRDGMVRAPRYEAMLLEQALKVLHLPPNSHVSLLAASISADGMEVARDFLQPELCKSGIPSESILIFLGVRAGHEDRWAGEVLREIYGRSTERDRRSLVNIAEDAENLTLTAWVTASATEPKNTIDTVRTIRMVTASRRAMADPSRARRGLPASGGLFEFPEWAMPLSQAFYSAIGRPTTRLKIDTPSLGLQLLVNSCHAVNSRARETMELGFPEEHWFAKIHRFAEDPSKDTLAEVVRVEGPDLDQYMLHAARFPWVILYAFGLREEVGDSAADLIRSGYMGDLSDWHSLEEAWDRDDLQDLAQSNFQSWREDREPFFPFEASNFSVAAYDSGVWNSTDLSLLLDIAESIQDLRSRRKLANAIVNMPVRHSARFRIDISRPMFERILDCFPDGQSRFLSWLDALGADEGWADLLNIQGQGLRPGFVWIPRCPEFVVDCWVADFSKVGLGRMALSRPSFSPIHQRNALLIKAEWERVKCDPTSDFVSKCLVALAVLAMDPPHERDDRGLLLQVLRQGIGEKEFSLHQVLSLMKVGQEPSDYSFVVDLIDSARDLPRTDDLRFAYDFLLSYQASHWTEISFNEMRPV
ncbi:hypothetical protein O1Q96_03270 [Streptomyces sp. Qhu-G9]|uniref:NACHT domain-containing protein n=1 Tax=Streptomyces sp. Qhu-G9 TaxID=3452799 RepID=UPI0022AC2B0D|nr:hypothetical protein [Streptomyces aurantiacus]WAU78864.1 hypothetical protein O1Q96_03270 [Streptomyces aurantiacus]